MGPMAVSPWFLDRLRCPLGGGPLRLSDGALAAADGRRWPLAPEGFPDLFAPSEDPEARRVEEANAEFHDRCGDAYDRLTVRTDEDYGDVSLVLSRLREETGAEDLLDAGCGSGVVLRRARALFPRVAGVDVSRGMLARCLPFGADLCRANAARLPFADASFAGVTGYSLLHHLRDPAVALREFARVLRPGGFLYTDNDSNAAFHRRFAWWLAIRRAAKAPRAAGEEEARLERLAECHHGTGLDADTLSGALRSAGFARIEVSFHHPPRPDEFTRLLMDLERHEPSPSLRYYVRLVAFR